MKIIKIGAEWCSSCLIMRPRWADIEKELPWLNTVYLDYDTDREQVKVFKGIKFLPTCIFIDNNGKELERLCGEQSKKDLLALIEKYKDM